MFSVPVYDERGDAVGFSINQAIGIGSGDHPLAILVGFLDSSFPEKRIDFFRASGEEAESDLGAVAVETLGKKPPLLGFQKDDGAWKRVFDCFKIVPKNPGMAFLKPGESFGRNGQPPHEPLFSALILSKDVFELIKSHFFYILS